MSHLDPYALQILCAVPAAKARAPSGSAQRSVPLPKAPAAARSTSFCQAPEVCVRETFPGVTVPEDACSARLPTCKGDDN